MPVFTFECSCGKEFKKIESSDTKHIECTCGGVASRKIKTNVSTSVYETRGNKKVKRNVEKELAKRSKQHHNKHELEEKIDRHGMGEAIRNGWDKKIKKL